LGARQWLVVDEKRMKYLPIEDSPPEVDEAVTTPTTTDDSLSMSNEIPTDALVSADLVKEHTNRNLVWLIEQTWRRLHAEDVTERFRNDGDGWLLDGTPYFKVIQELNELQAKDVRVKQALEDASDVAKLLKQDAYRGDLMLEPTTFGNIDLKVYTSEDQQLTVQSGPIATDSLPPFDWNLEKFHDIRHEDHPTLWNFPPQQVQFLWN